MKIHDVELHGTITLDDYVVEDLKKAIRDEVYEDIKNKGDMTLAEYIEITKANFDYWDFDKFINVLSPIFLKKAEADSSKFSREYQDRLMRLSVINSLYHS